MATTPLRYLVKPRWFKLKVKRALLSTVLVFLTVLLAHGQELKRFAFDQRHMGTQFRIVFYASETSLAQQAANQAFAEIDRLNTIFSDYDPNSELSQLTTKSEDQEWIPVSQDLWIVLRQAQRIAKKSGGAFDITVGPLSKLWRRAFRQGEFPKQSRIKAARERVAFRKLKVSKSEPKVKLRKPGMRLDAGGIAKGYALDKAMEILQSLGIHQALIDGGGDILVSGPPPGKLGWSFRTQVVNHQQELEAVNLFFSNCAVATSGDSYRYLEWEGQRYSHIIDPRTGLGVSHGAMVSVQAPTGLLADALASTLSILPVKKGRRLIQRLENCFARIILPKQEHYIQFGNLNSKK